MIIYYLYTIKPRIKISDLIDTNSQNEKEEFVLFLHRQSDKEVFIPVNLIGNLFVSNGMSAGNSSEEAKVQCISEIFVLPSKIK